MLMPQQIAGCAAVRLLQVRSVVRLERDGPLSSHQPRHRLQANPQIRRVDRGAISYDVVIVRDTRVTLIHHAGFRAPITGSWLH